MIVILHNIRSLHNVGSIFRTADASGVKKVYLCGITPSPLDRFGSARQELYKVSLGAERFVEWEKCKSAVKIINELKKEGFKIYAVEQSKKSIPYNSAHVADPDKTALLMGNEVNGLPAALLRKADKILEIPMFGKKESLNVAVAFGIVAFGLRGKTNK